MNRDPYDHVGPALADELDELRVLLGRVLEVGVLDDDDLAGHLGEPAPQRRALALVPLLEDQPEAVLLLETRQDVARAVGRTVVDHDQLDSHRLGEYPADDLLNRRPLVVDGHHDRQQRVLQNPAQPSHQRPIE